MRVSYVGANLLVKVLLALVRQAIGGDRWRVVYRMLKPKSSTLSQKYVLRFIVRLRLQTYPSRSFMVKGKIVVIRYTVYGFEKSLQIMTPMAIFVDRVSKTKMLAIRLRH